MIVSPEIDAVTPAVDLEHPAVPAGADRHALFRARDRLRPGRVAQLELAVPLRVIVCGVLNAVLSKVIVSFPPFVFAWTIAWRRSIWPTMGVSRSPARSS